MERTRTNPNTLKRTRRHARIRARVSGTAERPRLSIFKSNRFLYAQVIDDTKGMTIAAASTKDAKGTMLEKATALGGAIASAALKKQCKQVVFDRGGYLYTGRVKAVADAARKAGLNF